MKKSAKKIKKLLEQHPELIHSNDVKVISHVQREQGDWFINTIMIEGCDTPFKYKRKKLYKSLNGQRVNITYYMGSESVAGFDIDIMNVVTIKTA
jgi:hypothetical protein